MVSFLIDIQIRSSFSARGHASHNLSGVMYVCKASLCTTGFVLHFTVVNERPRSVPAPDDIQPRIWARRTRASCHRILSYGLRIPVCVHRASPGGPLELLGIPAWTGGHDYSQSGCASIPMAHQCCIQIPAVTRENLPSPYMFVQSQVSIIMAGVCFFAPGQESQCFMQAASASPR